MSTKIEKIGLILSIAGSVITLVTWLYPVDKNNSVTITGNNNPYNSSSSSNISITNITNQNTINSSSSTNHEIELPDIKFKHDKPKLLPIDNKQAILSISAISAHITIKKSKSGKEYTGGKITGTDSENIIYLPKGQSLSILVSGIDVEIMIERDISEYINIHDSGTGTRVREI